MCQCFEFWRRRPYRAITPVIHLLVAYRADVGCASCVESGKRDVKTAHFLVSVARESEQKDKKSQVTKTRRASGGHGTEIA
jgi:hypothetical protein